MDYINDTEVNEFGMTDVEDDEVVISTDKNSKIIACTDQVANYGLRSALWKNLTLWEFIIRINKIKILCKKKNKKNEGADRDEYNSEAEEGSDNESDKLKSKIESPSKISYSPQHMSHLLSSSSRICPKCDLLPLMLNQPLIFCVCKNCNAAMLLYLLDQEFHEEIK